MPVGRILPRPAYVGPAASPTGLLLIVGLLIVVVGAGLFPAGARAAVCRMAPTPTDGPVVFDDTRSSARTGFVSADGVPARIRTEHVLHWSDAAFFDLTAIDDIPAGAIVTSVRVYYDKFTGEFTFPHIALISEDDDCFYVNRFSGRSAGHNGQPVKQNWRVQFWTDALRTSAATIWPRLVITYAY